MLMVQIARQLYNLYHSS